MSSKAHVHGLMAEIGPLMELLEVTEFDDEDLWTLVPDEDTVLFCDYDSATGRLMVSAELGPPPAGGEANLYELLLCYNSQWQTTGGVRMALDGPGGSVVQIFDLVVDGLNVQQLRLTLANFTDILRGWREILAGAGAAQSPDDGRPLDPMAGDMIRV